MTSRALCPPGSAVCKWEDEILQGSALGTEGSRERHGSLPGRRCDRPTLPLCSAIFQAAAQAPWSSDQGHPSGGHDLRTTIRQVAPQPCLQDTRVQHPGHALQELGQGVGGCCLWAVKCPDTNFVFVTCGPLGSSLALSLTPPCTGTAQDACLPGWAVVGWAPSLGPARALPGSSTHCLWGQKGRLELRSQGLPRPQVLPAGSAWAGGTLTTRLGLPYAKEARGRWDQQV